VISDVLCEEMRNETVHAEHQRRVVELNALLASMPECCARWWRYTVSHRTFDIVVGDAQGRENVVLCLAAARHLGGPVEWKNQRLHVGITDPPQDADSPRWFVLEDDAAGFRAEGAMLQWKRNHDMLKHGGSLHLPWDREQDDTEQPVSGDGNSRA
jgi:hypothetical protein